MRSVALDAIAIKQRLIAKSEVSTGHEDVDVLPNTRIELAKVRTKARAAFGYICYNCSVAILSSSAR